MAGLYPHDKKVQINGQEVLYPGLDATGKYTSGDLNDPLAPPSRLDAKTLNLVIDNLNSLIKSMGLEPNNTNAEQLAALFSSAAIANTGIKRDSAGRAKVTAPFAADDIARKAEIDAEENTRYTQDIALSNRISGNDSDISSLSSRITSNDTDISSNDTDISSLSSRISNLQNYRSYETNTGKTWVNGQPIYRRCFSGRIFYLNTLFNIGTKRKVTTMWITSPYSNDVWHQNYGSIDRNIQLPAYYLNSGVVAAHVTGTFNGNFGHVVIEYYK